MAATTKSIDSKRRRFQPPITTFFTPSTDSHGPSNPSHLSYNHYSAVTNSPTPVVPAKVQASLLSVGMRVRKSIADGYKTNLAKTEKHTLVENNTNQIKAKTTTTHHFPAARSELTPFSGMSKSNEYNTPQPLPLPQKVEYFHYDQTIITDDDNDAFSLPPSSQESVDPELDIPTITSQPKKRTHQDFDFDPYEDDEDVVPNSYDDEYGWQDPLRQHPVTQGRAILSPTLNTQRRLAFAAQKHKTGSNPMDVEDFEEPAFLKSREEVDMDVDC